MSAARLREAGKLNDRMWAFGTLLQDADDTKVLGVLNADFVPFKDDNAQARQWCARRDAAQA